MSDDQELEPLKVTCTMSDCDSDLHCFKFSSRTMAAEDKGNCRKCGVALVDWERVHERNLDDAKHTFLQLKREYIRHHFWHKVVDENADKHARRKGRSKLREAARKRILSSVGAAQPARDGQQTPMQGSILYYAQHATACCCRTCLEYWHAIPKGRELTEEEVDYLTELAMIYVGERMPHLRDGPEKIPRTRRVKQPQRDANEEAH